MKGANKIILLAPCERSLAALVTEVAQHITMPHIVYATPVPGGMPGDLSSKDHICHLLRQKNGKTEVDRRREVINSWTDGIS
jgi:hypothetical protein